MKNFFRFCILTGLVLGIVLLPSRFIGVRAQTPVEPYDPQREGVVSGYLCIDGESGRISGVAPGVTLAQLNARCLPGDLTAEGESLVTGSVLTSATADRVLTLVITGDLNGDGDVSVSDMLMIKSYVLGGELTEEALLAGDVNYDGDVTVSDFLSVKAYVLRMRDIGFRDTDTREPMILLAPGETQDWGVEGAAYFSDNAAVATIDPSGKIAAGEAEGTTFVYARAADGTVIARAAVTVLEGGLSLTLEREQYALCPDQQLQVKPGLDHPVSAAVTWESSDDSICSVSPEGVLTGHQFGDAVIRATLPSGRYALTSVRVMPAIEEMDFEKHLYKLKPGTTRQTQLNLLPLDAGEEVIWTSSDDTVATVSGTGELTGHKYGTVTVTATGRYSGRTASCSVKVCDLKQVALTFDDGPGPYTDKLLDWLKDNEVKVTFFVVGQRLNSYKSQLKRIVDEGHELGYHSYSHKQQTSLSTEKIISDFESTNQTAIDITGKGFTLWRTPGGGYNQRVLDAVPLPHIMWAVDTLDWKTRNKESVYRAITRSSDDGEIVLLHDIHKTSVDGAIKAMEEMLEGDYEFLTVTELLSRGGTPPQPHTSYKKAP